MKKKTLIILLSLVIAIGLIGVLVYKYSFNDKETTEIKYSQEDQKLLNQIRQNIQLDKKNIIDEAEKEKVIELSDNGSLYYVAKDDKRYIFPTKENYNSWFLNVKPAKSYTLEEIQKYDLGGNVGFKPGHLMRTPTDYNLYLILKGERRAVIDKDLAKLIFGDNYEDEIVEIPNYYFTNYKQTSKQINTLQDFPIIDPSITIDENKGF